MTDVMTVSERLALETRLDVIVCVPCVTPVVGCVTVSSRLLSYYIRKNAPGGAAGDMSYGCMRSSSVGAGHVSSV